MEEWGRSVPPLAPPRPASESRRLSDSSEPGAGAERQPQHLSLEHSPGRKDHRESQNQLHLPAPRQGHQPEAGREAEVGLEVLRTMQEQQSAQVRD